GDREPQRVGTAARDILLVARGAVGRAHHAAFELAAGAVVVAHLDRTLETAARARIRRPVQLRLQFADSIARPIAEQRAIIHPRRIDDLAGVEHTFGIETFFHFPEVGDDPLAEHRLVKLRAHEAIAMLA